MSVYKWNAKDYENHSESQQIWARELISKLSLKGTEKILDIGCGDGKVTAEIARLVKNGHVVGIDNSSQMIKLAKKRYPNSSCPNLIFEEMDASNLLFTESFDVIFSNAALHWIKNHKPLLQGIFNSLKTQGKIFLQMGGKGNAKDILAVLENIISSPEWAPYFSGFGFPYGFYGVEEYRSMVLETGFKIVRIELIPKDMIHTKKSDMEGWIRTTWLPYTERIPRDKRDMFINQIASQYIATKSSDTDGKIHVSMVRLEVEAIKNG